MKNRVSILGGFGRPTLLENWSDMKEKVASHKEPVPYSNLDWQPGDHPLKV